MNKLLLAILLCCPLYAQTLKFVITVDVELKTNAPGTNAVMFIIPASSERQKMDIASISTTNEHDYIYWPSTPRTPAWKEKKQKPQADPASNPAILHARQSVNALRFPGPLPNARSETYQQFTNRVHSGKRRNE